MQEGTLQGLIAAEDQSTQFYPVSREIASFTTVICFSALYEMTYTEHRITLKVE